MQLVTVNDVIVASSHLYVGVIKGFDKVSRGLWIWMDGSYTTQFEHTQGGWFKCWTALTVHPENKQEKCFQQTQWSNTVTLQTLQINLYSSTAMTVRARRIFLFRLSACLVLLDRLSLIHRIIIIIHRTFSIYCSGGQRSVTAEPNLKA